MNPRERSGGLEEKRIERELEGQLILVNLFLPLPTVATNGYKNPIPIKNCSLV